MICKIIFQVDLGTRLLPCFNSDSGVPYSDVNLATRKAHSPKWSPDSSTSEVTTIQLEFRDLSRCTGDPQFEVSSVCCLVLLLTGARIFPFADAYRPALGPGAPSPEFKQLELDDGHSPSSGAHAPRHAA